MKRKYAFTITLVPSSADFSDAETSRNLGEGALLAPNVFQISYSILLHSGLNPA